MALYGLRTRDAAGNVTLDTTVTPIRSLKMMTVTGNGSFEQTFSIPEIKAQSFVVVDALADSGEYTWTPPAFWSAGSLRLRQPGTSTWQVMVLSQGGEPFSAPGTYGFRARNGDTLTQIDSINRVLSVHSSGGFSFGFMGPGNQQAWAEVTFPTAIKTTERPLVFLNAVNYMMVGNFYIRGAPGNWTGFRVKAWNYAGHGSVANQPMQIKWFCASYQTFASGAGQYGARVRDESGAVTFVTTANLALLNGQPANNSFVVAGDPIANGQYYNASYQMPWTGSFDDYVLANALFSVTNVVQTTQPFRTNFGGFLPGNRNILQMYCENYDSINPLGVNGRTLFASRPMKSL
ncbi:hypothetical protein IAE37_005274 [Pseudomonas sp. S31]|uniref:hypothetical protein n=1 Tax=Pseudomonas sp. S31 TaxID=1564473 RepID=UPI001913472E|nr:hypothetical protein [Pseudomonas sp. S31]MBK5002998.1 hypothetical protein [Pseudomonas sp. S31]